MLFRSMIKTATSPLAGNPPTAPSLACVSPQGGGVTACNVELYREIAERAKEIASSFIATCAMGIVNGATRSPQNRYRG